MPKGAQFHDGTTERSPSNIPNIFHQLTSPRKFVLRSKRKLSVANAYQDQSEITHDWPFTRQHSHKAA